MSGPVPAAEIFGPKSPPTSTTRRSTAPRAAAAAEPAAVTPVLVNLADVKPEKVIWIWPGRLAAGKLALLVGDPGLGKSWITLDVAAHVSAGRPWPDGSAAPRGSVLLLSAEDGLADTIRPRLDALGADVSRVHHLAVLRARDTERSVQLADTRPIEQAVRQTAARVLIIDPIAAYLGATDSHRDAEVRGLMAPLAALAERTGVAVLGVMHLSKGSQRPAIYRTIGSIAFAAAARIVLAVAVDQDQPDRRIVAPVKSNLSAPPAALAYTLTDGCFVWEPEPVSGVDIDVLLSGPQTGTERAEQTDAEQVIVELLEHVAIWPIDAKVAIEAGQAHGVHERTLRRTAQRMGIRIARNGFGRGGRWVWHRPDHTGQIADNCPQGKELSPMSAMQNQAHIEDNTHIEDTKTAYRARARGDDDDGGRL